MNKKLLSPMLVALLGLSAVGCNEDNWYDGWYDSTPDLEEADPSYSTSDHWAPQDADLLFGFGCVALDDADAMAGLSAATYIDYYLADFGDATHVWAAYGQASFEGVMSAYVPQFYLDGNLTSLSYHESLGGAYSGGIYTDQVYMEYFEPAYGCTTDVDGEAVATHDSAMFNVVVSDFVTPSAQYVFNFGGEASLP